MSADNWAQCPRCKQIAKDRKRELGKEIPKAYGNVTPEEYKRMITELSEPIFLDDSLREDYEIGIWDGEFSICYRAHCDKCNFLKEYRHDEKINASASERK